MLCGENSIMRLETGLIPELPPGQTLFCAEAGRFSASARAASKPPRFASRNSDGDRRTMNRGISIEGSAGAERGKRERFSGGHRRGRGRGLPGKKKRGPAARAITLLERFDTKICLRPRGGGATPQTRWPASRRGPRGWRVRGWRPERLRRARHHTPGSHHISPSGCSFGRSLRKPSRG